MQGSNLQPQGTFVCTDQPHDSNLQQQGTVVLTDQPQASNLQQQGTVVFTDQPQGSNLQQQGTTVCKDQPQPQLTAKLIENQFQQSSWAAKSNSERRNSDIVLLTKPAPERRVELPRTYLPLSVFSCLFCFWLTGACAVICSLKASAMIDDGDIEGARSASRKALVLNIISIVLLVVPLIAVLIRIYIVDLF